MAHVKPIAKIKSPRLKMAKMRCTKKKARPGLRCAIEPLAIAMPFLARLFRRYCRAGSAPRVARYAWMACMLQNYQRLAADTFFRARNGRAWWRNNYCIDSYKFKVTKCQYPVEVVRIKHKKNHFFKIYQVCWVTVPDMCLWVLIHRLCEISMLLSEILFICDGP